jgi:hypothetical protein
MFEFRKVASALARRTKDTGKDKSTDLDIAQASHALKILRGIAAENPSQVLAALKLTPVSNVSKGNTQPKPKFKRTRKPIRRRHRRRHIRWHIRRDNFSTLYSRQT